tara:strand:- start:795 stop:4175 length:3381 start_codon:yes stop_codon:yes gene_type:complete
MDGNIIGRPIKNNIGKQIKLRQQIHGAGYNDNSISRTPEVLNFLNNRNSWIKFASGVSITDNERLKDLQKLENNDYLTNNDIASLLNENLAKNYILFNGIQSLNKQANYETIENISTQTRGANYTTRSGVRTTNSWNGSNDKLYGGMGGNSRGLQPTPGITGLKIESINNGSLRKATVTLKAFNKFQFGIIEILYLRLGMVMMLEWGWDKYIEKIDINNKPIIKNVKSSIIDNGWFNTPTPPQKSILNDINSFTNQYEGNYQGFFGKVNNFSWKLNQDNHYDITVNLITLGSVIESLTAVVPASPVTTADEEARKTKLQEIYKIKAVEPTSEDEQETNTVITNIGSDRISQFIAQQISTFFTQTLQNNKDYYFLPNAIGLKAKGYNAINVLRDKVPPSSRYYIRFGEFMRFLEDNIILKIKSGSTSSPRLNIDYSENLNRINYEPNLIPLDPSIGIFKPIYTSEAGIVDSIYLPKFESLKDFAELKGNVAYARLMNFYLNLDWVSTTLVSNKNSKGELDLYTFLQKILDGMNTCMGNVTELTVKIKDDINIYFLDENPITGYEAAFPPKNKNVPFNILGYTPTKGSTFVTNFDFQTKITPKLMNMISIGAANPKSDTNSVSAIGYNSWNKGLVNRYEDSYEQGVQDSVITTSASVASTNQKNEDDAAYALFKKDALNFPATGGYRWSYKGYEGVYTSENYSWFNSDDTNYADKDLRDKVLNAVKKIDRLVASKNTVKESDALNDYPTYLLDAFGGTGTKQIVSKEQIKSRQTEVAITSSDGTSTNALTNKNRYTNQKVALKDAQYWTSTDAQDFIDRGKVSFKRYKTEIDKKAYGEGVVTGIGGFIPVTLSLTCEGIGGISIFNSLAVNQNALPNSYPRSLEFIINGINHEIKDNKWVTNLTTISRPRTDKIIVRTKAAPLIPDKSELVQIAQVLPPTVIKGPIPPLDPNQKLKILDRRTVRGTAVDLRTYKKYQSIEWLVGELNPFVQTKFREFFTILESKYPGYTLRINATYRTYQRSIELKAQNSNNATAGRSPHNYAYGLDMNVIDPTGKTYTKSVAAPWVSSGIPAIAKGLGLRWGGEFKGYVDCVHFDVTNVTKKARENAAIANKGLPKSQWVTNNINYV